MFGSIEHAESGERTEFNLWPKQRELCDFLEANRYVLTPKSRQKGFSEISAERAILTMLLKKNARGVVISVNEDKATDYKNDRFLPKYEWLLANSKFPVPKIIKNTEREIRLDNGSKLRILPASKVGAAGITGDFLIFDEAGGIDETRGATVEKSHFKSVLRNSIPAMNRRPKAWMMIIGTSVPGTHYNELVRDAYNTNNEGIFKYFFIGCMDEPGRDAQWYKEQQEILGDDVYLQEPRDMDDFFYVKEGLVMRDFSEKRHVHRFDLDYSWEYYVCYDHGTQHPAAAMFMAYDPIADHVYFYDEEYFGPFGHDTPVRVIAPAIRRKATSIKKPIRAWIADNDIFKKRGVDSVAKVFAKYGLKDWKAAKKHDEKGSLEVYRDRFLECSITIHPRCIALIEELKTWRYKMNGLNSVPQDSNNDCIDASKYGLAYLKQKRLKMPKEPVQPYSKEARKQADRAERMSPLGGRGSRIDYKSAQSWQRV
jgi:hypothetical protein